MRRMSFMLTRDQIRARTKTVTRRLGWRNLKPGERIRAVNKCMGLKKGEKAIDLAVLEVVSVHREQLKAIEGRFSETLAEGFPFDHPKSWPSEFIAMFCEHMKCTPETEVTRIEFRYVDEEAGSR